LWSLTVTVITREDTLTYVCSDVAA